MPTWVWYTLAGLAAVSLWCALAVVVYNEIRKAPLMEDDHAEDWGGN